MYEEYVLRTFGAGVVLRAVLAETDGDGGAARAHAARRAPRAPAAAPRARAARRPARARLQLIMYYIMPF